ncbi:MAG TPA: L,D-transpeptidase [Gemmatimonadota bacterium]
MSRPIATVLALLLSAAGARGQAPADVALEPVSLVVSISERLLTVHRGESVLLRFPVGVGTGVRLAHSDGGWEFSTPTGVFEIGRKKEDPVWYAPDWYYVERGRPIPPAYSDERYQRGILGDYALYLSDEIAIHGTPNEDSVGRASSHGCLRMRNADIAAVFPLVDVGTKVVIVP